MWERVRTIGALTREIVTRCSPHTRANLSRPFPHYVEGWMRCVMEGALGEGGELVEDGEVAVLLDAESRTLFRQYKVTQQTAWRVRRGKEKHNSSQKWAVRNCLTSGQSFPMGPMRVPGWTGCSLPGTLKGNLLSRHPLTDLWFWAISPTQKRGLPGDWGIWLLRKHMTVINTNPHISAF